MKYNGLVQKLSVALLLTSMLTALPCDARAIDESQTMERMDKIEHDLMLLHRQIARGEAVSTAPGDEGASGNPAQLEVRISAIEEQLRELRGKTEEDENSVHKLSEQLEKFQKDTEFRFNDLTSAAAANQAAAKPETLKPPIADKPAAPAHTLGKPDSKADTKSDKKADADSGAVQTNFASPREHYNYAFRLLNQTQYEESATAFESFTSKYPKDPLVGNAYYWEGETYYIRRDFVNAADNFRKGFEALPEGPKAADNLLKLAMSLNAVNRDKEACLVLQQVITKFKKTSSSVADKADQEQKRIGCHK